LSIDFEHGPSGGRQPTLRIAEIVVGKPFDALSPCKDSQEGPGVIRRDKMAMFVRFNLIDNADGSDSTLDRNHISSEISASRGKLLNLQP
jgi:hypothetical protein